MAHNIETKLLYEQLKEYAAKDELEAASISERHNQELVLYVERLLATKDRIREPAISPKGGFTSRIRAALQKLMFKAFGWMFAGQVEFNSNVTPAIGVLTEFRRDVLHALDRHTHTLERQRYLMERYEQTLERHEQMLKELPKRMQELVSLDAIGTVNSKKEE